MIGSRLVLSLAPVVTDRCDRIQWMGVE